MIISVNGFEEAKNYPVLFNTSEILMDNNKDVFYVKTVDSIGKYSISTYQFQQIENERPLTSADFVTKQQFDNLSSKLDALLMQMQVQLQSQQQNGGMTYGEQSSIQPEQISAARPQQPSAPTGPAAAHAADGRRK